MFLFEPHVEASSKQRCSHASQISLHLTNGNYLLLVKQLVEYCLNLARSFCSVVVSFYF